MSIIYARAPIAREFLKDVFIFGNWPLLWEHRQIQFLMLRPDGVSVWREETVREGLRRYRPVMNGERPAKLLICKSIRRDLGSASDAALWLT
jgi:hypothetical protein